MFFCQKENMDNMLWLRPLMLAFLMAFRIGLTTPQEQQSDCQFPSRWKGTWYHSGFPHPLNISANHISSKGTCVQHQESMFIMVDRHNCQKCMVIHEKHPNVLQYKESYCHPSSTSKYTVESLCSTIESDSALFFMFRTEENSEYRNRIQKDNTEACPFERIEYAFSYSTRGGAKVCENPPSRLDTCIDNTKLVFQFQACPDVPGSERTDEILECVASWKEGSSRYLVGRTLTSSSQSGNAISGSRYQCFKYEKHYDDQKQAVVTKMAQSYSGACEGLWSAEEGDRTYTLWTVPTDFRECGLPEWIVNRSLWTSLDAKWSLKMTPGSSRRFRMLHRTKSRKRGTPSMKREGGGKTTKQEIEEVNLLSHLTCKQIVEGLGPSSKTVKLIAHQKQGCLSGFICLELTYLHENVIHIRMGNRSRHEDEACRHHFFTGKEPLQYFLADERSIECPFHGKFVANPQNTNTAMGMKNTCTTQIQSGCPLSTDMLIHLCDGLSKIRDVSCIGSWIPGRNSPSLTTSPTTTNTAVILKNSTLKNVEKQGIRSGPMVNITSEYPVYLALRDQKGLGECLQYRRIENSTTLQVIYYRQNTCFDPFWQRRGGSVAGKFNFTWQGISCQEALMDAHAISRAPKFGFLFGGKFQTFDTITMSCHCFQCFSWLTVMIVMHYLM